jgi:hypothetical protein
MVAIYDKAVHRAICGDIDQEIVIDPRRKLAMSHVFDFEGAVFFLEPVG